MTITQVTDDLPDKNPEFLFADPEDPIGGEIIWIEATKRNRTPTSTMHWFWQAVDWFHIREYIEDYERDNNEKIVPSVADDGKVTWLRPEDESVEYDQLSYKECEPTDESATPWFKVILF